MTSQNTIIGSTQREASFQPISDNINEITDVKNIAPLMTLFTFQFLTSISIRGYTIRL